MTYTDLTNEELEMLVEMSIALKDGKTSYKFFNKFVNLLEFSVLARKANV